MPPAASEAYGPPVPSPPRNKSPQRPSRAPAKIGPYVVEAELARGGMGVVYRVRHEATGQLYALKSVLSEAGPGRAEAVLRFQREAEALALVEHPHIVRVHAADLTHEPPYLVQTLLPGGSLADRLRRGPLPPTAAAALMAKVARGIQLAHELGVLHRDLKPENTLFDDRDEPRVIDLGLATATATQGQLTSTGELLGTPAYMSPEQARGERADARSDVHALGACLWAALVGRPPHGGGNVVAILESVLNRVVPPPSREARGVPPALDAIVARALAPEPADRFQGAGELAEALERVAAGDQGRSRPTGRASRPPAAGGARRALVATALLAAAAGAVALSGRQPPGPPTETGRPRPRPTETQPLAPAGPLEQALGALAAFGPADAAAVASLRLALEVPGTGAPGAEEAAALEAALAAGNVRDPQAAIAALRSAPRAPLGAELAGLLDAVAARPRTPSRTRDELELAAGLVEPQGGPGRARRLEQLRRRATLLAAGLSSTTVLEGGRAADQLRALAPLARAIRRLEPAGPSYDAGAADGPLFDLVMRLGPLPDEDLQRHAPWVRAVVAGFPDDPVLVHAALLLDPPPPEAWRATADLLARTLDALRARPPTINTSTVHGWLVSAARFTLQGHDDPGLLELLREEVGSPHAGQFVNLRLLESLSFSHLHGAPPALAPAREAEARAAVGRVAGLGGPVKDYGDFSARYISELAPAWYRALPDADRPALPLRERLFFGPRPGTYVLFGGAPETAQALPDGVELVWVPETALEGLDRPVPGFLLGATDLTPAQLEAAGAPRAGADGFVRWFHRDLRLPTAAQVQAAQARAATGGAGAGLRVALDGP